MGVHWYVLECVTVLLGSDCLGVMCVLVGACLCVWVITFLCLSVCMCVHV